MGVLGRDGWHTQTKGKQCCYIEILKEALTTSELDYLLVLLRAVGPMDASERGNDKDDQDDARSCSYSSELCVRISTCSLVKCSRRVLGFFPISSLSLIDASSVLVSPLSPWTLVSQTMYLTTLLRMLTI